jgi:UDP-N-acetylglucosamine 2-epimerase
LRDETEWGATVETGWNKLVGADPKLILDNWFDFVPPAEHAPIYGAGNAADCIAVILNDPAVWGRERKNGLRKNINSHEGVISK